MFVRPSCFASASSYVFVSSPAPSSMVTTASSPGRFSMASSALALSVVMDAVASSMNLSIGTPGARSSTISVLVGLAPGISLRRIEFTLLKVLFTLWVPASYTLRPVLTFSASILRSAAVGTMMLPA